MKWEDAVKQLAADPEQQEFVRLCYFDRPVRRAAERFYASNEWQAVRQIIGSGNDKQALDVGAGNGIVSYALARDGWSVTAVEPDSSDLVGCGAIRDLAQEAELSIRVVNGLAEDVPTGNGLFDVILVRQVFHHAPDIFKFAEHIASLLKPGGLLLTWRDHVVSQEQDLPAFFDRHPLHHLYGGENAFTEGQYRDALERAGLDVVQMMRHFDSAMNYGPLTPKEIFSQVLHRKVPGVVSRAAGSILGNQVVFTAIRPLLAAVDSRPGRLVAFLSRKGAGM